MNTVGPTTNRKKANNAAATALALDNHLTPRSIPLTAESTKHAVSTAITPTASTLESRPEPKTSSMPR
jgi:hypothetical protein